jgi:hypothetical protein
MDLLIDLVAGGAAGFLLSAGMTALMRWVKERSVRFKISVSGIEITIDPTQPDRATEEMISRMGKPQVFISHSSADKHIADRLAQDLQEQGLRIWLSSEKIRPGDNLKEKVREGLQTSGYLLAILSRSSIRSPWAQEELRMALQRERQGKWPRVIPAIVEDVEVPTDVREKVYVDLRKDYKQGMAKIARSVLGQPGR